MRIVALVSALLATSHLPLGQDPFQPAHNLPCRTTLAIENLQGLVRKYHPEVLAARVARDSVVVGFVFDRTCRVVRQAVGRRAAGDRTTDDALFRLFPDLAPGPAHFAVAGGADAVPSREPGRPMIRFAVLK